GAGLVFIDILGALAQVADIGRPRSDFFKKTIAMRDKDLARYEGERMNVGYGGIVVAGDQVNLDAPLSHFSVEIRALLDGVVVRGVQIAVLQFERVPIKDYGVNVFRKWPNRFQL